MVSLRIPKRSRQGGAQERWQAWAKRVPFPWAQRREWCIEHRNKLNGGDPRLGVRTHGLEIVLSFCFAMGPGKMPSSLETLTPH